MYNRYVPQPDGSFRRTRLPDRSRPVSPKPDREAPCPPPEPELPCPEPPVNAPPPCREQPPQENRPREHPQKPPCRQQPHGSIGGFFRQLLPKDMDTGDLLIILLLLLMAGDCPEDQNTALLTLVLYLFM